MKIFPSPFKVVHPRDGGIWFEAEFDLPTDDCPGTINKLVIQIRMLDLDDQFPTVAVLNRSNNGDAFIARGESSPDKVGRILYGLAQIKQKYFLELKKET